jgi:hypothetical protein
VETRVRFASGIPICFPNRLSSSAITNSIEIKEKEKEKHIGEGGSGGAELELAH